MIAQQRSFALIMGCIFGAALIGCADYATQDEITAVEQKVETVEYSLQRTRRELENTVLDTQRTVEEVAMRQAVTESSLAAMGSGFNELAIAVQDAHETSMVVFDSQQRLVSDVEARLSDLALDSMPSVGNPDKSYSRYVGQGRDMRQGIPLPIWTLDYSGPGSLTQQREDGTQQRYNLRQIGLIMYALDDRGLATACFEQAVESQPAGDGFLATLCDNRYGLYEFSPALVTPNLSTP